MLFKTAQQYGVVSGVKSSRQIKESQDRKLVGIRSCENVINNTKESCFCTVTSTVGRLKFVLVCEVVEIQIICELYQDNLFLGSLIEMEDSRPGDSFSFLLGSRLTFLSSGLTTAVLNSDGTSPDGSDLFKMFVSAGRRRSEFS